MIDSILCIILSLLTVLMNYIFLKSVFPKPSKSKNDKYIMIALFVFNYINSVALQALTLLKLILNISSYVVMAVLVFKVKLRKSIIANLVYFGIYASLEIAAFFVVERITNLNRLSDVTNQNSAFLTEVLCEFIMLMIILGLNVILKRTNLSGMDVKGWVIFALFPIFTLATIVVLIYDAEIQELGDMFGRLIIFSFGLLILNILLFILLDNVIKRESDIREKEILIEQAEYINKMYRSLSDEREKQKARSHDYLNHLQIMLMLAKEGKRDEEIRYIEEQIGSEIHSIDVIDTGNPLINAVLNTKYLEAHEKGIVIPIIADNLVDLSIRDSDLVTILTNVLDNAIDAADRTEDKRIVFKMIKDGETLYIDSSNSYSGDEIDTEVLLTTKADKKNHGYGIANIRKAVNDNNGNCYMETKDGVFHITISIPIA